MRKLVSVMLAMTFVFSLGFAATALASNTKVGVVKAVDKDAGTLTIQFDGDKDDTTLKLDAKYLSTMVVGGKAKVYFDDAACTEASRAKPEREATPPVGC